MSKLAACAQHRREMDRAVDLLNQAMELFQNVGYQEGVAGIHKSLGELCHSLGRYDDAIEAFQKALAIQQTLQHRLQIANCQKDLAETFLTKHEYEEASRFAKLAQAVYMELSLDGDLAKTYSILARIHHAKGDLQTALFMSDSALRMLECDGDIQAICVELCNLGAVHISMCNFNDALRVYMKVLAKLGPRERVRTRAFALNNAGCAHRMLGNYEKAREFHLEAIEIYEELNLSAEAAQVEANLRRLPP